MTAVTTVSAHKDGPATVKKEDPDIQVVSSTSASSNAGLPKLGLAQGIMPPALKGGTSLLKSENPIPFMGNPNEIKIKRDVPMKMGKKFKQLLLFFKHLCSSKLIFNIS